jgi:hypothetical protein
VYSLQCNVWEAYHTKQPSEDSFTFNNADAVLYSFSQLVKLDMAVKWTALDRDFQTPAPMKLTWAVELQAYPCEIDNPCTSVLDVHAIQSPGPVVNSWRIRPYTLFLTPYVITHIIYIQGTRKRRPSQSSLEPSCWDQMCRVRSRVVDLEAFARQCKTPCSLFAFAHTARQPPP